MGGNAPDNAQEGIVAWKSGGTLGIYLPHIQAIGKRICGICSAPHQCLEYQNLFGGNAVLGSFETFPSCLVVGGNSD